MVTGNAGTTLLDAAMAHDGFPPTRGKTDRRLNPRFVLWLMGFPMDWFDGVNKSPRWATQLSPKQPTGSETE